MNYTENSMEGKVKRTYKDSLFKFLFGNEDHKEWALSLFNAINGTDYQDADELEIVDSDNVFYLQIREDVVIIYDRVIHFFEHQSTYTPNLPLRMLNYLAKEETRHLTKTEQSYFSPRKANLLRPKFYVIYNGEERPDLGETAELRLSDLYDGKKEGDGLGHGYDLDLIVHVINVNNGYNKGIQGACRPLLEYCWMVDSIRKWIKRTGNLEKAVDEMLKELPEEYEIYGAVMENRVKVIKMMFDEMDNEMHLRFLMKENESGFQKAREEGERVGMEKGVAKGIEIGKEEGIEIGKEKGKEEGRVEGEKKNQRKIVQRMDEKGYSDEMILDVTGITADELERIRKESGNG